MKTDKTFLSSKKGILHRNFLRGIYTKPLEGLHYPTLVVGLGGTGLKVLRHVKRVLQRHDAPDIELAGIDCDLKENGRWPDLPPLAESELLMLDPAEAVGGLAKAAAGHPSHKFINDFLPNQHGNRRGLHASVIEKVRRGDGAGQWPRSGRLLTTTNITSGANLLGRFEVLRDKLQSMRERLRQEGEGIQVADTVKIIVVCGLSGGMGPGGILDVLALLRKTFGPQAQITLITVLPGRLLDRLFKQHEQPKVTRRNALGVLCQLLGIGTSAEPQYTFEWGPSGQFAIGADSLVDGTYLVGHALKNGVVVNDYMELCQAVALFLYSLLGSGVGADLASDAINGYLPENPDLNEPARKFHALGIAALEYPIEEMVDHGLRHTAQRWMGRWLNSAADRTETEPALGTALDLLKLRSLDSFREHFASATPKVGFKTTAEARADFLRRSTDEFLHGSKERLQRMGAELRDSVSGVELQLRAELAELGPQLQKDCDNLLLGNLSASHAQGQAVAAGLLSGVKSLRARLVEEQPRTGARLDEIRSSLDRHEKRIKLLSLVPGRLGGGLRRRYLDGVNESLRLMLQDKADAYVSQALAGLEEHLANRITNLTQLRASMERYHEANNQFLATVETTAERPSFVQYVVPRADFRKWVEGLHVELPGRFDVQAFTWEALMEPVLDCVAEQFRLAAMQLNLPKAIASEQAAAHENPDQFCPILNKLRSLDIASEPIIELTPLSPSGNQLNPQKFVAAAGLQPGDESILPHFSQPGRAVVQPISIQNPHMVVCTHLIHAFAVTHLPVFTEEHASFQADQWYYQTLPGAEKFLPLEPLSEQTRRALQTFGKGLMLGLIDERSTGFHANVRRFENRTNGDPCWGFKTFRREPTAGAKMLLQSCIVCDAEEHAVEPRAEDLLGTEVEAVLATLARPDFGSLVEQIHRVADALEAQAGPASVKRLVEAFTATLLQRVDGSRFTRRLENDLTTALNEYVIHMQ